MVQGAVVWEWRVGEERPDNTKRTDNTTVNDAPEARVPDWAEFPLLWRGNSAHVRAHVESGRATWSLGGPARSDQTLG